MARIRSGLKHPKELKMSGELMRYASGDERPARVDRAVATRAKVAHDEVRLRAFQADGALALAGHIMDGVTALDRHRRDLDQGDPVTRALLADIEQEALFSVRQIQRDLYNGRGL
jgi:hypothetical protein